MLAYFLLVCGLDITQSKMGEGTIPSNSNDLVGVMIIDPESGQSPCSLHVCQTLLQNLLKLHP